MLPIRLCQVSLIHPQTPINKSLPKAFPHTETSTLQAASKKIQNHSEVQKLCRNQASKPSRTSRTSTFKYEEHSKRNPPNHLPRSQSLLESSSKASRNFKKPQIGEALWIQASKAPKNFHHKASKTKNMRRIRRTHE